MKRITSYLLKTSVLLILFGMVGHEVIPHHHHNVAGKVKTCCESHQHDEKESSDKVVCNILANIYYKDNKPQIIVHVSDVKHCHTDHSNLSCCTCNSFALKIAHTKTPFYIPQADFAETFFYHSLFLRGPPGA